MLLFDISREMPSMLTDIAIRNAQARDKPYKLTDSGGLYLLVNSVGKYWRMNYRYADKQKTLAIGAYPAITLSARVRKETKREICLLKILTR
jgi:hypothetical protein